MELHCCTSSFAEPVLEWRNDFMGVEVVFDSVEDDTFQDFGDVGQETDWTEVGWKGWVFSRFGNCNYYGMLPGFGKVLQLNAGLNDAQELRNCCFGEVFEVSVCDVIDARCFPLFEFSHY